MAHADDQGDRGHDLGVLWEGHRGHAQLSSENDISGRKIK